MVRVLTRECEGVSGESAYESVHVPRNIVPYWNSE